MCHCFLDKKLESMTGTGFPGYYPVTEYLSFRLVRTKSGWLAAPSCRLRLSRLISTRPNGDTDNRSLSLFLSVCLSLFFCLSVSLSLSLRSGFPGSSRPEQTEIRTAGHYSFLSVSFSLSVCLSTPTSRLRLSRLIST